MAQSRHTNGSDFGMYKKPVGNTTSTQTGDVNSAVEGGAGNKQSISDKSTVGNSSNSNNGNNVDAVNNDNVNDLDKTDIDKAVGENAANNSGSNTSAGNIDGSRNRIVDRSSVSESTDTGVNDNDNYGDIDRHEFNDDMNDNGEYDFDASFDRINDSDSDSNGDKDKDRDKDKSKNKDDGYDDDKSDGKDKDKKKFDKDDDLEEKDKDKDKGKNNAEKGDDGDAGRDMKRIAKGAKAAVNAATTGAKVAKGIMIINAIQNFLKMILAVIKAVVNAIKGFFIGIFNAVTSFFAGAFTATTAAIAGVLSISTAAATIIASFLTVVVAATPIGLAYSAIQHTMMLTRNDSVCAARGFSVDEDSSRKSISEQQKDVVEYATKAASHKPHYPYSQHMVTAEEPSLKHGYVCNQFVAHCFMNRHIKVKSGNKEIPINDFGPCSSWYSEATSGKLKDYAVKGKPPYALDDLMPGDVLLFAAGGIKDSNPGHMAIYLGPNKKGGDGLIAHAMDSSNGITKTKLSYNERTGQVYSGKYLVKAIRPYDNVSMSAGGGSVDGDSSGSDDSDSDGGSGSEVDNDGRAGGSHYKKFYDKYKKGLKEAWVRYHIYPTTILICGWYESSLGTNLQIGGNNIFSVKTHDCPYVSGSSGGWATFKTVDDAINCHAYLFANSPGYYSKVTGAKSATEQLEALNDSPYCEGGYSEISNMRADLKTIKEWANADLPKSKYNPADFKKGLLEDESVVDANDDINSLNSSDGCGQYRKDHAEKSEDIGDHLVEKGKMSYLSFDMKKLRKRIGKQSPGHCNCFADAYGAFIASGNTITDVRYGGYHGEMKWSTVTATKENIQKRREKIWNEIANGYPIVITGSGTSPVNGGTSHFVTVIGFRKGADEKNWKQEDMVILDPYDCKIGFYGSTGATKGKDMNGSVFNLEYITYRNVSK